MLAKQCSHVRGHGRTSKLRLQQSHLRIMNGFEQKWLYVGAPSPSSPLISQPDSERIIVTAPLLLLFLVEWRWFSAFGLGWVSLCFVFLAVSEHQLCLWQMEISHHCDFSEVCAPILRLLVLKEEIPAMLSSNALL